MISIDLSLRELETSTCTALAVLFTFLHAAVARQEAGSAEGAFEVRVILRQGSTQAHDDRAGFPRRAAAVGVDEHVHLAAGVGNFQRAEDRLAIALGREVVV